MIRREPGMVPNGSSRAGTPLTSGEIRNLADTAQSMALHHAGSLKTLWWENDSRAPLVTLSSAGSATTLKCGTTSPGSTTDLEIPWLRASTQFTRLELMITFGATHDYPYRWLAEVSELTSSTWAGGDLSHRTRVARWPNVAARWRDVDGLLFDTAIVHATCVGSSTQLLRVRPSVLVDLAALPSTSNADPTVRVYQIIVADAYAIEEVT